MEIRYLFPSALLWLLVFRLNAYAQTAQRGAVPKPPNVPGGPGSLPYASGSSSFDGFIMRIILIFVAVVILASIAFYIFRALVRLADWKRERRLRRLGIPTRKDRRQRSSRL
jgi:hypothetical protein